MITIQRHNNWNMPHLEGGGFVRTQRTPLDPPLLLPVSFEDPAGTDTMGTAVLYYVAKNLSLSAADGENCMLLCSVVWTSLAQRPKKSAIYKPSVCDGWKIDPGLSFLLMSIWICLHSILHSQLRKETIFGDWVPSVVRGHSRWSKLVRLPIVTTCRPMCGVTVFCLIRDITIYWSKIAIFL